MDFDEFESAARRFEDQAKDLKDLACPILSAGFKQPVSCSKNCAWYNPDTRCCDVTVSANVLFRDPETIESMNRNEEDSQTDNT